jgi:ABC-type lipoprotein release transport system permease subunit
VIAVSSWFLARRYLLTRWVNVLGVVGIAVAVWALVFVTSIFSGFIGEIRDGAHEASPDLLATALAPRASYRALRPVLEADPDVVTTAPRLQHYALLYPEHGSRAVVMTNPIDPSPARFDYYELIGIDPEREAATTALGKWLDAVDNPLARVEELEQPFQVGPERQRLGRVRTGTLLDQQPALGPVPGILLPAARLRRFDSFAGQWLDLVTAEVQPGGGEHRPRRISRELPVAGAFRTRHRLFDMIYALVPIDLLREMLGHPQDVPRIDGMPPPLDLVSAIAIRARAGADLPAIAARLELSLAGHGGGSVLTWEEQNAQLLGAVDRERALMQIVLFAVLLVAAFLVFATLYMMVSTKTHDIGILTAMGASPSAVATIFVVCALIVGALGAALGTAGGVASALNLNELNAWTRGAFGVELFPTHLYNLERIPVEVEPGRVTLFALGAVALSLLVALIPARRAARLDPVAALVA